MKDKETNTDIWLFLTSEVCVCVCEREREREREIESELYTDKLECTHTYYWGEPERAPHR